MSSSLRCLTETSLFVLEFFDNFEKLATGFNNSIDSAMFISRLGYQYEHLSSQFLHLVFLVS